MMDHENMITWITIILLSHVDHIFLLVKTFQTDPQHLDIQFYLPWQSRRKTLLYCCLTVTASNCFDPFIFIEPATISKKLIFSLTDIH